MQFNGSRIKLNKFTLTKLHRKSKKNGSRHWGNKLAWSYFNNRFSSHLIWPDRRAKFWTFIWTKCGRCFIIYGWSSSSACWNGHTHVFIDCYQHQTSSSSSICWTMLGDAAFWLSLLHLVRNVLPPHHRCYLKFYYKHMSILQKKKRSLLDAHHIIGMRFFFHPYIFYFHSRVYRGQMPKDMKNLFVAWLQRKQWKKRMRSP